PEQKRLSAQSERRVSLRRTIGQCCRSLQRRLEMRLRPVLLSLSVLLIVASLLLQPSQVDAQRNVPPTYPPYKVNYFPETGFAAVNWFWETWKNTPNALFVLGYPISQPFIEESFTNPGEYYRVQYFERAVLEEH